MSYKVLLQNILPSFFITKYKTWRCIKIIKNFDINDEPDLYIAQYLVSPQSSFVDIGANIGVYTKYLSQFAAKIISIEPVPFTFSILEKVLLRFNLRNVEPYQLAISNKIGKAVISVPEKEGTLNYYRAAIDTSIVNSIDMKYEVQTKTIDSLFQNNGNEISLIKCDVEGHELACIQGAINFLNNYKPAWIIEVSGNPDDPDGSASQLFQMLENFGYSAWFYERGKLKKREEGDSSTNYFFLQSYHLKQIQNETNYI